MEAIKRIIENEDSHAEEKQERKEIIVFCFVTVRIVIHRPYNSSSFIFIKDKGDIHCKFIRKF